MLWKFLGYDRMHENKIYFFLFLKREINLKVFEILFFMKMIWFFLKYFRENQVF
jgi:hypothetical protein